MLIAPYRHRLRRTGAGRALVASAAAFLVLLPAGIPAATSPSSSSASSSSSLFDTSSDRGGGIHFLAVGDWGGSEIWPYTTQAQIKTASGMASVATSRRSEFVLALGDNFYSHGISGGADAKSARARFASTFERVYGQESLAIPWYVTSGNHDHLGNVSAQLEFHGQDPRWVYPNLFHSMREEFSVGAPADDASLVEKRGKKRKRTMSVEIVLVDTVILAGMHLASDAAEIGYFDPLPGPLDRALAAEYLGWIEDRLSESTADYLFVAGHYPIYSACRHGSTDYLIQHVDPLLRKYNVTAYLSGHEHCQLHIQKGGMDYLLTGTGDECCYEATNMDKLPADAELKYLLSGDRNKLGVLGGFASFEAKRSKMVVNLHNEAGRSLYEAELHPRRKKSRAHGSTASSLVGADVGQQWEEK